MVNFDQPTTGFMRAEFEFCCRAGKPSLEYDVCYELDEFKNRLAGKLGKQADAAGKSGGWINFSWFGGGSNGSASKDQDDWTEDKHPRSNHGIVGDDEEIDDQTKLAIEASKREAEESKGPMGGDINSSVLDRMSAKEKAASR